MYKFVHLYHGSLTCSSSRPFFLISYHLTLVYIMGGILLFLLMLVWFYLSTLHGLVLHAIYIFEFSCFPLYASWFNANYSLLYLVRFYFRGDYLDHQLLLIDICSFYMLHWCSSWLSLFLSSTIFPSLAASSIHH